MITYVVVEIETDFLTFLLTSNYRFLSPFLNKNKNRNKFLVCLFKKSFFTTTSCGSDCFYATSTTNFLRTCFFKHSEVHAAYYILSMAIYLYIYLY